LGQGTGEKKVNYAAKDSSDLTKVAMNVGAQEFDELIDNAVELLGKEKGRVGNLLIEGKLAIIDPKGEITIVGDVHGDLESVQYVLKNSGFVKKARSDPNLLLVFLGDYGDRGFYSSEVYYVVLKLKELFPEQVVLMRGNHEGPNDLLAHPHDLPSHLHRKFGGDASRIYEKLRELFGLLYSGVLVKERYILLHGGPPSQASTIDDIAHAHQKHPSETHLEEILWSDPVDGIRGTYPSPRGAGRLFGEDITDKLLKMLNVKTLIRGHEPSGQGYKINHNGKAITLFSRKGPPYFNEQGAYLHLNAYEAVANVRQLLRCVRKF
jgi:diadenosine tetraphosphatase ApaH/serine/threonine PP2A family protein phosphatase